MTEDKKLEKIKDNTSFFKVNKVDKPLLVANLTKNKREDK